MFISLLDFCKWNAPWQSTYWCFLLFEGNYQTYEPLCNTICLISLLSLNTLYFLQQEHHMASDLAPVFTIIGIMVT